MANDLPRILVVEDSYLVAIELKGALEKCGCAVVGPVGRLDGALEAVRQTKLDGAILDINLGDDRVWPVAELLEQQGVPFVLATGYGVAEVPPRFRQRPILAKPVTRAALLQALAEAGIAGG